MQGWEIERLAVKHPNLGLGVCGGYKGLVPIDIDVDDQRIVDAVTAALPLPVVTKAGLRGFTAFYRGDVPSRNFKATNGGILVQVIPNGQTVIPPTIHPGKPEKGIAPRPYRWTSRRTLFNTRIDQLTEVTPAHMAALRWRWRRGSRSSASTPRQSVRLQHHRQRHALRRLRALNPRE